MINRLCNDLLSRIFVLSLEKQDEYYTIVSSNQCPLSVRSVSRRWHYIAMSTPELWRSISVRRRVRPPFGYDFQTDTNIVYEWLSNARGLPLSIQFCYGDIKNYGNKLTWHDLLQTITSCLSQDSTCERVYIRVPDDCTEKILWSLQTSTLQPRALKSLTLRSTRERLLQRRYKAWWMSNYDSESFPRYCHVLDVRELPSLEEVEVHYPGPLVFDGISSSVKKITLSLYKSRQLNVAVSDCFPYLQHLVLDLRDSLQLTSPSTSASDWTPIRFSNLRTLKIRSSLHGFKGKPVIEKFLKCLQLPQIRSLYLRNALRFSTGFSAFKLLLENFNDINTLEELEIIDFPLDFQDKISFPSLLNKMPKLRTFAYREVRLRSYTALVGSLLKEFHHTVLTMSLPQLACIAIDVPELKHTQLGSEVVLKRLASLLSAWMDVLEDSEMENSGGGRSVLTPMAVLPRGTMKDLLPYIEPDVAKRIYFACIADLETLVAEDDLDDGDDSFPSRRKKSDKKTVTPHGGGKVVPEQHCRISTSYLLHQHSSSFQEVQQQQQLHHQPSGSSWMDSMTEVEMLL